LYSHNHVHLTHVLCSFISIKLAEGLKKTYFWIKEKVEEDKKAGIDLDQYKGSVIVKAKAEDDGASVRTGDTK